MEIWDCQEKMDRNLLCKKNLEVTICMSHQVNTRKTIPHL